MRCKINRLLFFIRDLFVMLLDLLLPCLQEVQSVGGGPFCSDGYGSKVYYNSNKDPLSIGRIVLLLSIFLITKDDWNFGGVRVMKIGYDGYILRLEGCPKDVLGGGSEMVGFLWVKKKKKVKGATTEFSSKKFQ
ncbi:hypothetical protein B296_00019336 [Ensete ventricosum]|uniref:Uncharacterized protein n=1 Tax=Ensete ventricosum TaxID=4639 RepID=A0A426YZ50_ENSVE|nr:hypothetical protein B296_00019336 [Ensete ventricosum]